MNQKLFVASAILVIAVQLGSANAGELLSGIATCDLNSTSIGCEWKPKDCYKPTKPPFSSSAVSGFNFAVEEFNDYLQRAQEYKQCIINDAKSDVGDRFPELVIKGVKKENEQVDEDIDTARRALDLAKIGANQ